MKGKRIYVGGLGDAIISKGYGFINAHFIKEEDGTKSWQLLPDEMRGDEIIKSVKVFPLEKGTIKEVLDSPLAFGLSLHDKQAQIIYDELKRLK